MQNLLLATRGRRDNPSWHADEIYSGSVTLPGWSHRIAIAVRVQFGNYNYDLVDSISICDSIFYPSYL